MTETPLEIARRVWPGDWEEINQRTYRLTIQVKMIWCSVTFYHVGYWIAEGGYEDIAHGDDLSIVLAKARDKVQAAVAELARAVGLEVVGG